MKRDASPLRIISGMTRHVILIGGLAIKFPHVRNGAYFTVLGMLANMNERDLWKSYHHRCLAKVYWCAPFGLFLVMKRYRYYIPHFVPEGALPFRGTENKPDSLAIEGGVVILLDYGNNGVEIDA